MFKILSFLIAWIILTPSATIYAQESPSTYDQLKSKLEFIINPFESHLPKSEMPIAPEPTKTCSDGIQYCLSQADCVNERYYWYNSRCNANPKMESREKPPVTQGQTPDAPPIVVVDPDLPMPVFTISGIIWNSERPQAIINQQIVDIGDSISGAKVTHIRKSGIDIMFNGKTATIQP